MRLSCIWFAVGWCVVVGVLGVARVCCWCVVLVFFVGCLVVLLCPRFCSCVVGCSCVLFRVWLLLVCVSSWWCSMLCWFVRVFVAVLFMVLFLWSCCFWFVTILGFCCFEKSHLLVAGVWCCPLLLLFDSALVCHPCFVYGSVQHHVVSGCPCSGSCSFIHYYGSVLYFYCSCCFWFSRF